MSSPAGAGRPLTPGPEEIAVVPLPPGASADVLTQAGIVTVRGQDPARWAAELAELAAAGVEPSPTAGWNVALVPADPQRAGFGAVRSVVNGGLRLAAGQHKLDRPVWAEAERLARAGRCCYVQLTYPDYYGRPRRTATGVRPDDRG